jgi:hypothetical protein
VQFQRARSGETSRASSSQPNTCLVIAEGTTYSQLSLGLGTVHPNCRVSHYGFRNDDANEAWTENTWTAYSSSSKKNADESLNLVFRFDSLDAGSAVTFTWAYILNAADLIPALTSLDMVVIEQPASVVSGTSAVFSAQVNGAATLVRFFLSLGDTVTKLGNLTVATVANPTTGGGLYQIVVDTTAFDSGDGYVFKVSANVGKSVLEATRVITIDNGGARVSMTVTPSYPESIIMDIVKPSVFEVKYESGDPIDRVMFYLETSFTSTLLSTVTMMPYSISLTNSLATGAIVTVRAVAYTLFGAKTVSMISGKVYDTTLLPSPSNTPSHSTTPSASVSPSISVTPSVTRSTSITASVSPTPSLTVGAGSKVGNEVFLKGLYLELGVHSSGSFGTRCRDLCCCSCGCKVTCSCAFVVSA